MKLSGLRSKKRGADDDGQQLPTSAAGSSRLSIGSGAQLPDTAPPVPAEATPIAPAQMGQKRVACPQCGVVNLVDAHVPRLRCGHCHLELSALGGSTQSSVQVLCGWCKTPNMVPAGTYRMKCGACAVVLNLPHAGGSIMSLQMEEEMRVQRAIAISQEEEDIRKATAASLLDRHQSCNMRSRWSACLPACHCLSSLLEVWRK
eukprot:gnl/TRDRNA2_/TRDRNA2_127731_c0_seq3.p1 gnl/TRDRNA2_/TRDRNA2_127731_c0~~gnl/TRDRNA2_/TRDRNA2_127731_c0_seq3.p1  ORF type:complete len:203 (+),score=33.45 gnl/TRDRNA2_/TRDRNA2_127731_c0_seq3:55-663(+)